MPNRLEACSSLYLRQHATNPVDWWPWGDDALAEARRRDVPVLLSIGYSACHWCHVMAHESFEDPVIAAAMNDQFVCIKVDREERPDVDALYLGAVQAMTGHAGWPLTVFLTPAGEPFYGGTYFPPASRHGLPAFRDVLDGVAEAWRRRRTDIQRSGRELADALRRATASASANGHELGHELITAAVEVILSQVDQTWGGMRGAPKFPQPATWQFLLQHYVRRGQVACRDAVLLTLRRMAEGGVHDQLAGGFHRYSVDGSWTVPHFEKMLYDNAQLAALYLDAWRVSGDPALRRVVESTLDYLLAEMRSPEGAFYATQDADADGVEGLTFVWTPDGLRDALGKPQLVELAQTWFGVSESGNVEHGASVLTARRSVPEVAALLGTTDADVAAGVEIIRKQLLAARRQRTAPATDRKIVVAWNGLAMVAFARAGAVLGRSDYVSAAREAAQFVWDRVLIGDALAHSLAEGTPGPPAFQDDYAALILGLLELYQADLDGDYVDRALTLAEEMLRQFGSTGAGLQLAGVRHDALIAPTEDWMDSALPSGNGMAAAGLLRLAALCGREDLAERAETILRDGAVLMRRAPSATGTLLTATADYLGGSVEVAVIDNLDEGAEDRRQDRSGETLGTGGRSSREAVDAGRPSLAAANLIAELRRHVLPGMALAYARSPLSAASGKLAPTADRPLVDGEPVAYVCRRYVCEAPSRTAAELKRQLEALPYTLRR